ncbi:MAG TPA: hypothetical protein VGB78_03895 [Thermoplasmata archaeon]
MVLEELLQDKSRLLKLVWIGFIMSLVFIGIGVYYILAELVG